MFLSVALWCECGSCVLRGVSECLEEGLERVFAWDQGILIQRERSFSGDRFNLKTPHASLCNGALGHLPIERPACLMRCQASQGTSLLGQRAQFDDCSVSNDGLIQNAPRAGVCSPLLDPDGSFDFEADARVCLDAIDLLALPGSVEVQSTYVRVVAVGEWNDVSFATNGETDPTDLRSAKQCGNLPTIGDLSVFSEHGSIIPVASEACRRQIFRRIVEPMNYEDMDARDLVLRDLLARDRTVLANERTLLAYLRTAIALLAAGGTLLKIFQGNMLIEAAGVLLLASGIVVAILGIWRFRLIARQLNRICRPERQDTTRR